MKMDREKKFFLSEITPIINNSHPDDEIYEMVVDDFGRFSHGCIFFIRDSLICLYNHHNLCSSLLNEYEFYSMVNRTCCDMHFGSMTVVRDTEKLKRMLIELAWVCHTTYITTVLKKGLIWNQDNTDYINTKILKRLDQLCVFIQPISNVFASIEALEDFAEVVAPLVEKCKKDNVSQDV
jgi:hypothetical protein